MKFVDFVDDYSMDDGLVGVSRSCATIFTCVCRFGHDQTRFIDGSSSSSLPAMVRMKDIELSRSLKLQFISIDQRPASQHVCVYVCYCLFSEKKDIHIVTQKLIVQSFPYQVQTTPKQKKTKKKGTKREGKKELLTGEERSLFIHQECRQPSWQEQTP
jgi:hypothetical protein